MKKKKRAAAAALAVSLAAAFPVSGYADVNPIMDDLNSGGEVSEGAGPSIDDQIGAVKPKDQLIDKELLSQNRLEYREIGSRIEYYNKDYRNAKTQLLDAYLSLDTAGALTQEANELMEEDGECRIIVVDSKCASMGEGLFVHKALKMQAQGKSMEETARYLNELAPHLTNVFTVDDLNHLYRGGRVSKAAAIVGTIAAIKPILHVDDEGHLIPISKVRGRKKSLNALVDYMEEKTKGYPVENDIIFISHGDALEDAEYVKAEIEKRFGIKDFKINHIGPTIGAHSGPGTIALFFEGSSR